MKNTKRHSKKNTMLKKRNMKGGAIFMTLDEFIRVFEHNYDI